MLRSLRLAARGLVRRPTFTLTAVATLAVGIGATTALFSTVSATVLNPLPYASPEDLYALGTRFVDGRWTNGNVAQSYVAQTATAPSVLGAVSVMDGSVIAHADDGSMRQLLVQSVGEEFFDLFGLNVSVGRTFRREDHASWWATPTAIISDRIWAQLFGRDRGVVGRVIQLNGFTATIVGVAPPGFDVPEGTDMWFAAQPSSPTGITHQYQAYLRVAPGTSKERLDQELEAVMAGLAEQYPQANGRAFVTTELVEAVVGEVGVILVILLAGSALLLLLGCTNVATLLLGRASTRTRELAVSSAQGATRWQLAGQFVAEAFLLATAGAALGLGLGALGVEMLLALGASELPRMAEVSVSAGVLAFAFATLLGCTLVVGLMPALLFSEPKIGQLLGEGGSRGGGKTTRRLLSGLVVVEVALAVALVSPAGWLTRSYANMANIDPGFEADGRLVFEALLAGSRYLPMVPLIQTPGGGITVDPEWVPPPETPRHWMEEFTARVATSGRVTDVGAAFTIPLERELDGGTYVVTSPEGFDPDRSEIFQRRLVTPGFFDAMGMQLLAGRTLARTDEGLVAVVNEEFVRRVFPGSDPVGSTFFWGFPEVNFRRPIEIVGVVADVPYRSLREPAGPAFYAVFYPPRPQVVMNISGEDPEELIPSIVAAAGEVDPQIPIEVRPLQAVVDDDMLVHRIGLLISLLFAALSLLMAAIGIYGVVALSTAQRSRELAVRGALGASPGKVASLVVMEGQLLAALGITLGILAAYAGGRFASSRLYGVSAADPLVLGTAGAIVLAITLVAHLIPALRARKASPAESLKAE